ncbi:hypothetical protein [Salisaeta longa]|uniref:hypothetical protein n=1 Tax=Salisaeta longa TaxID=503170 RepID=UPI0003B45810|nr:hypothetical protein [Salisaeta longa]
MSTAPDASTPNASSPDESLPPDDAPTDEPTDDESLPDGCQKNGCFTNGCATILALLVVLAIIGHLTEDSESSADACATVEGVYVGTYSGTSAYGMERGDVGLMVESDCSYIVTMDGQQMGDNTLDKLSTDRYAFASDVTVRFSGGSGGAPTAASWVESGNGYRVRYTLQRVE